MYDAAIDNGSGGYGASVENAASIDRARASANVNSSSPLSTERPWSVNDGTAPAHTCVSGTPTARLVYAPTQVATAYDTSALDQTATTRAVRVAVIDLGGGYSDADVRRAARCFHYAAPRIEVLTGDGISGPIRNDSDETELDLHTVAAFAPGSTIQLIEATNGPA